MGQGNDESGEPTMADTLPDWLPIEAVQTFTLHLHPIQELDSSGEDCPVCDDEDATITVQWYGRDEATHCEVSGECCTTCLPRHLAAEGVNPDFPVTVEYER